MDISSSLATFGAKKGLPYREFLNIEIMKLMESGMLQMMLKRDAVQLYSCMHESITSIAAEESVVSIRFEKVVLPFVIFAIGVFFALSIMFIEKTCATKNE